MNRSALKMNSPGRSSVDSPTPVRKPSRMPTYIDSSDDEASRESLSMRKVDAKEPEYKTFKDILHEKIKLEPDEELVIYEEEIEDDEELGDNDGPMYEIVEASEAQAQAIGMDKFHPPSDDIIQTRPKIVIKKYSHTSMRRIQKINVPRTDIEATLHERFSDIQNKVMKRHITPYFQMINYLKWKQEAGFGRISNQLKAATKIKNKAIKTSNTVSGKLAGINAATKEDFEVFWREQMDYWANAFKWYREDGPSVSKEELDREIEGYMANRGYVPEDDKDVLDRELEEYMASKGIRRHKAEGGEALDEDMDDYMAKRGQPVDISDEQVETAPTRTRKRSEEFVSKADLDDDIENYFVNREAGGGDPVTKPLKALAGKLAAMGYKKREERSLNRTANGSSVNYSGTQDLDDELEAYMSRTVNNTVVVNGVEAPHAQEFADVEMADILGED